jgi:hypothetical protein
MTVRAKMHLSEITTYEGTSKKLKFYTRYDNAIPEDRAFTKATPNGSVEMLVDNPAALEQFEIGKHYYVDFTPIDTNGQNA